MGFTRYYCRFIPKFMQVAHPLHELTPFKLHTDACDTGLGAVLYQTREDGTKAVIAYASRSLNKAESHYPAHKLEFLALKWAVVEKFHKYFPCQPLTCTQITIYSPMYRWVLLKLDFLGA